MSKCFKISGTKNVYKCFSCSYLCFCKGGQSVIDDHIREIAQSFIMDNKLYENWQEVADELNAKLDYV